MNPPDPNRTHEEQIDHDLRGLRMEIEQLGRMLYEEVGKSRAIKARVWRQVWFNRFVIVLIATLFLLVTCQHAKSFFGGRYMGYANGKECCKGMCHVYGTIEDKIACCAQRCPQWVDECVQECVFGGTNKAPMPRQDVYAAISRAGRVLRGSDDATPEKKDAMQRFLSVMSRVEDRNFRVVSQRVLNEVGV